jgi:hypothetical protein
MATDAVGGGESRPCGCSFPFTGYGSVSKTASAGRLRWGVLWFGGSLLRCFGSVFSGLARECWVLGCVISHGLGGHRARRPFRSVVGAGFPLIQRRFACLFGGSSRCAEGLSLAAGSEVGWVGGRMDGRGWGRGEGKDGNRRGVRGGAEARTLSAVCLVRGAGLGFWWGGLEFSCRRGNLSEGAAVEALGGMRPLRLYAGRLFAGLLYWRRRQG